MRNLRKELEYSWIADNFDKEKLIEFLEELLERIEKLEETHND